MTRRPPIVEFVMQPSLAPSSDLVTINRLAATTRSASTSDASLIRRIALGDKVALQELFIRHHIRVYRFILRLLGNTAVAEELTSEVFLDVWRQPTFECRSAVSTWILAIARYKALTARRHRSREQCVEIPMEAIEDPTDDPEQMFQKKNRADILRRYLAELSVEHREIVDLVYYRERSVEEAATILGIPKNTVKTRMFYARRRLAHMLTEAGMNSASI
jgi:RNA polymerase sigma-70 factor (ECF subfamily)